MKNLKSYNLIIMALLLFSVIMKPTDVSAWGDSNGGRPSYTIDEINQGVLGDKIVFNSISNSVMGDEKNFIGARENTGINAGPDNIWNGNDITVENGKEYIVRLYVHNNSPKGMDAVAEDVHVAFSLPHESAKNLQINGFIRSSNATPTEYWDYVNFHSDTAFHLEYIGGSGLLENNGIGSVEGGLQLSDDVVKAASGGTLIGYDALDGRIPGCYQYDSFVTIVVKAVYDTDYAVDKKVRVKGDADQTWKDQVDAKIGDEVEFRIEYINKSEQVHNRVVMRDVLPENLEFIPGSIELINAQHPNGATTQATSLIEEAGTVIGNYGPGANGVIYLSAKVVDDSLTCGSNSMINWGGVTVDQTVIADWAQVVVWKKRWRWLHTIIYFFTGVTVLSLILSLVFTLISYCRKCYLQKKIEFLELEIKRLNLEVENINSKSVKDN